MVGHTGDLKATVQACETVDRCLGELLEVADSLNARWLVTSDHGNADDMVQRDKKGKPMVSLLLCGLALYVKCCLVGDV